MLQGAWYGTALAGAVLGSPGARAAQPTDVDAMQIVVTAPGGGIDRDDAQVLSREDMTRNGQPDLLGTLTRTIAGVTLQDAQGNPWQPTLVYRGYLASPLQGEAQGLAVYLDGGRFNQPFGDTVGFDLLPDAAIRSITLLDSSPVYGFNALGGALVIETATGRSDPGFSFDLTTGSYGRREASVAAGANEGRFNWFVAGQARREDGWRDHSPSQLANLYADVGIDGTDAGLHVKLVVAGTDLSGNGVTPVDLLAARRSAVFTWPDRARSNYRRLSLHPRWQLSDATHLEATLYGQRITVRGLNGDNADISPCEDDPARLCAQDLQADEAPLLGSVAMPMLMARAFVAPPVYGVLNRARAHTRGRGILAQIIDERPLGAMVNRAALGFSFDYGRTDFDTTVEIGTIGEDRKVTGIGQMLLPDGGPIGPVSVHAHNSAWGLFASDVLPITPRLHAEIGLRWNYGTIHLIDHIGHAIDGRHHYARLNPGIEFDWSATDGLTLRAGYSETNRMPTPAELSCADENAPCSLANFFVADPYLKQVVARSLEAGATLSTTHRGWKIDALLSLYRTTNEDDIQHVASRVRGRSWFTNIGRTRRQGAEASVKAQRGNWHVAASYALTQAASLASLTMSSPENPFADPFDGTITVTRGDRLPGIPRHSATLSLDYAGRAFSLGGDIVARSSQILRGDAANLTRPVPGYVLANLRARIALGRGLALTGAVQNLFNRRYATFGAFSEIGDVPLVEAPDATGSRFYGPGSPRRWSLGFSARF